MKTVIFNNRPPYLEFIEQELQLPQIENTEFLVIDLFAGCGGLALGFEAAGFRTVGYEMLEDPCTTYQHNLQGKCHQVTLTHQQDLVDGAVTCRNLSGATGDMLRIRLPDGRRRRLTVREGARLQSFPDWFQFKGSEDSQYNQIGNAVPPIWAKALAGSVKACLQSACFC